MRGRSSKEGNNNLNGDVFTDRWGFSFFVEFTIEDDI
jgi:hypothetical protein